MTVVEHRSFQRGGRRPRFIATEEQLDAIRTMTGEGYTTTEIGEALGVPPSDVAFVRKRENIKFQWRRRRMGSGDTVGDPINRAPRPPHVTAAPRTPDWYHQCNDAFALAMTLELERRQKEHLR